MTTRLSSLQFPTLRAFVERPPVSYVSIETAKLFDQRPFRSMLMRRWITYVPGRGFKVTKEGRAAWSEFQTREIWRKNPDAPLTKYFDEAAYHLKPQAVPKKGEAA